MLIRRFKEILQEEQITLGTLVILLTIFVIIPWLIFYVII